jgi:YggT family protein
MPFNPFLIMAEVINLWMVILIIRILMSWVAPRANWSDQPFKFLYMVTEPVMAPFRRIIPPIGGLDLSPMLLFILLQLLQGLLYNLARTVS